MKNLCAKAREILIEESNVQRIDPPVTVSVCVHVRVAEITVVMRALFYDYIICIESDRLISSGTCIGHT